MTSTSKDQIAEAKAAIDTGNFKVARNLLEELIKQGDSDAMFLRAQFGLPDEDESSFKERHLDLLQRAAALGHAGAIYTLSVHFEEGDFVARDQNKALSLLQRGADLGHPHALWRVGVMLLYGTGGLTCDVGRGLALIEKAAAARSEGALRTLGGFYAEGKFGYPKNPKEAARLLAAAEAEDVVAI